MKVLSLVLPLTLFVLDPASAQTRASTAPVDEIIVTGRQPGPPMWRVVNGENVLWIFPQLDPVPKDMIWESGKAAAVIAEAQEALDAPNVTVGVSPALYANPLNLFRGIRLAKRMSRDAEGRTLQETLPPELHARFLALQAKYFSREAGEFEELRPFAAGERLVWIVQNKEGLGGNEDIVRTIQRLIRRGDIVRTEIEVKVELEGSFGDIAQRAEDLTASLDPADELECFESQLRRMEEDIDKMRSRANSWARGYIDEFRGIPLPGDEADACLALILGSSERELLIQSYQQVESLWLENAERALRTNRTTFAILPITDLLKSEGPIAKLRAKGYEIREP